MCRQHRRARVSFEGDRQRQRRTLLEEGTRRMSTWRWWSSFKRFQVLFYIVLRVSSAAYLEHVCYSTNTSSLRCLLSVFCRGPVNCGNVSNKRIRIFLCSGCHGSQAEQRNMLYAVQSIEFIEFHPSYHHPLAYRLLTTCAVKYVASIQHIDTPQDRNNSQLSG